VLLAAKSFLVIYDIGVSYDLHYLALVVESAHCLRGQFLSVDVLEGKHLPRVFLGASVHDGKLASADHLVSVV